ncbi:MAG: PQQ-binding-like beta-propeller repeat protein, partial [Myxococcales bacterium]|nr:PQQ-binding-like beta-propeller repeat protein [Myxococcales bacterium]
MQYVSDDDSLVSRKSVSTPKSIWLVGVVMLQFFAFASGSGYAQGASHAEGRKTRWNDEEQAEVESRVMWSREFPSEVADMWAAPGGLLVVVAAGRRYLIDSPSGNLIWEGPAYAASPITGEPYPIIVEGGEAGYHVRAYRRDGKPRWQTKFSDRFVAAVADPARRMLLTLAFDASDKSQQTEVGARVRALSLDDGKLLWTAPIGSLSNDAEANNAEWLSKIDFLIAKNHAYLALDKSVLSIALSSGKLNWNHEIQADPQKLFPASDGRIRIWKTIQDDVVLATGPQVVRLSPKGGIVWSQINEGCKFFYDIDVNADVVLASCQGDEDHVMLFDAATGREKWRKPLPSNLSRKASAYRFMMEFDNLLTHDRVLVPEYGHVNAFDPQTGRRLFTLKSGSLFGLLQGFGKYFVVSDIYREVAAFTLSDGEELWTRKYRTPADFQRMKAAVTSTFNTYTVSTGLGLTPMAPRDLVRLPLALQNLAYSFAVGARPEAAPKRHKYFLTLERGDLTKPIVVAVDLGTGKARTHRLLRFGAKCYPTVLRFEDKDFLIQA